MVAVTYLAGSADTFPEREVADDVNSQQAQRHVPFDSPQVVQTFTPLKFQDESADKRNMEVKDGSNEDYLLGIQTKELVYVRSMELVFYGLLMSLTFRKFKRRFRFHFNVIKPRYWSCFVLIK